MGMWALGVFLFRGEGEAIAADRVQAYAWFLRSAALGFERGVAARDEVHALLTPEERQRAEALAAE
jgi:TPR repeat protein